jgi:hypothetical protein
MERVAIEFDGDGVAVPKVLLRVVRTVVATVAPR